MFGEYKIAQLVKILYFTSLVQSAVQLEKRQSTSKFSGDVRHKVKMGEANVGCDDGVNTLAVDWFDSPLNYTCYHSYTSYLVLKTTNRMHQSSFRLFSQTFLHESSHYLQHNSSNSWRSQADLAQVWRIQVLHCFTNS